MKNGGYESQDEWYAALVTIARENGNGRAVRDRSGWVESWEIESPAQAYFSEFPAIVAAAS